MERTRVHYILFLTCIILPDVRSEVTCNWTASILSEGKCFLYNQTYLSYADAKCSCLSSGGVLAKVTTKTQMIELAKNFNDDDSVWIGANDIDVEGTWMWEDGGVATELYYLWYTKKAQPSNKWDEDCVNIYRWASDDIGTYDDECITLYPFLCMEKDENTTPNPEASTCKTNDPTTTELTTKDPATTELTTIDPATTELTTKDTVTTEITTKDPATTKSTINEPATTEPEKKNPTTNEPTTNEPDTTEPTTAAILVCT